MKQTGPPGFSQPRKHVMPSSHGEPVWQQLEQYVRQDNSELLRGTTMAVDVRYWLRRMEPVLSPMFSFQRGVPKVVDHMSTLCCAVPATLRRHLIDELTTFANLHMRIILVFEGMPPYDAQALSTGEVQVANAIKAQRDLAWQRVSNGSLAATDVKNDKVWHPRLFEEVCGPRLTSEELMSELMRCVWDLRSGNLSHVDFIRAPCTAAAQMAYMVQGPNAIVNSVYGPPTQLWVKCFGQIPAVILEVTPDTFHFLVADAPFPSELPNMYEASSVSHESEGQYQSAVFLTTECSIEGLRETPQDTVRQPPDQQRLDELVYLHHSLGLLSTALLAAATTATMVEFFPPVDSKELRAVLERIIPLRTQLTCKLLPNHHHHQNTLQLKWYRWFKAPNHTDVARPPPIELDEWDVSSSVNLDAINFSSIMQYHTAASKARRSYTTIPEVVTVVYLKFLDLLGYFTHSTVESENQQTERSGKSVFSEALGKCRSQFSESAVLLIELVRTKGLALETMTDPTDGSPITSPPFGGGSSPVNRNAALLTRVFSLAPVEVRDDRNWDEHVGKDLVAFWCIVRTFRTTLRHLGEVIAVTSAPFSSPAPFSHMDMFGRLPFSVPHNFVLGALMEYCVAMGRNFRDNTITTPEGRLRHLAETFPCIKDIKVALQNGLAWCEEAYAVVQVLSEADNDEPAATKDYLKALLDATKGACDIAREVNAALYPPRPRT